MLQYTYDELDRIISSSVDGTYTYDALGNILSRGGVYNLNNELLEDNDFIYSWSIEGKLLGLVVKDSFDTVKTTIEYKYDGLDRRISKTVNRIQTKFIYDNENIIAELDAEDNILALYLHGPGVDDPIMMARDVNKDGNFEETELFFFSKVLR